MRWLDKEVEDTHKMYNKTVDNTTFTPTVTGVYKILNQTFYFEAGKTYDIRIELDRLQGNGSKTK